MKPPHGVFLIFFTGIVFIIVLLCFGPVIGKMYKYVDENGVVTFQDYPPSDLSSEQVETLSTVETRPEEAKASKPTPLPDRDKKKANLKGEEIVQKPKAVDYSHAQVELYVTDW